MTVLPIIERELRAAARNEFTYWLRVLGAAAALAFVLVVMLGEQQSSPQLGAKLFGALNTVVFFTIWALVPLLTADSLSRERREGTLGLLFLTPVTALGVVVGKTLIHALRALTLLLAILPVLALPILVGGVGWREAIMALLLNFGSIFLALAAGLLASAHNREFNRAVISAVAFAAVFMVTFESLNCLGFVAQVAIPHMPGVGWVDIRMDQFFPIAFFLSTGIHGMWTDAFGRLSAGGVRAWLWNTGEVSLIGLLISTLAVFAVARRIQTSWREEPPSARRLWWRERFCTPVVWRRFLRRSLRRQIERNPIGWLERRRWEARLVGWSWLAVLVSIYSTLFWWENYLSRFHESQIFLGWLLAGSLALTAAGSFRRERETGFLELLLVSPLRVGQIIGGRLLGLWGQFVPSAALYLAVWFSVISLYPRTNSIYAMISVFVSFITLPIIGLFYSLHCRQFIVAFLWTFAVGMFLPVAASVLLGRCLRWVSYTHGVPGFILFLDLSQPYLPAFLQIIATAFFGQRLYQNLTRRLFALERTTG